MALHAEVKRQRQAALEALKIIRGERTMDNASPMALQLCAQFGESFIRTIANGEFNELVILKPLPVAPKVKPIESQIVEEILDTPKPSDLPNPEKVTVKGKIKKSKKKYTKPTVKRVEDAK